MLKPSQRTAVFDIATGWNTTYIDRGHSVHFFYINLGDSAHARIARVEIPMWVATNKHMLDSLHTALVEQWRIVPLYQDKSREQKSSDTTSLIVTEGKTDWKHLKAAFQRLGGQGLYRDIDIEFLENENPRGDEALLTMCANYSETKHGRLVIFVFDRDNPGIVKKVSGDETYKSCQTPSSRSQYLYQITDAILLMSVSNYFMVIWISRVRIITVDACI